MGKQGCRDCDKCSESAATSIAKAPLRLAGTIGGGFAVGMFRKHCPQCGHLMKAHKLVGGRFKD